MLDPAQPIHQAMFQAFDISPIGVVVGNHLNEIVWPNKAFCALLGYPREALVGVNIHEIAIGENSQAFTENIQRIMRGEIDSYTYRKRFYHRDGSEIVTETQLTALNLEGYEGKLLVGHVIDTSLRVDLERAAEQSNRMRTVGRLAGAIAHDFNNLLTAITANGSLLRSDVEGEALESVVDILAAAEAGARLTSQLLSFSKGGATRFERLDLSKCVNDLKPTLRSLCPGPIQLICQTTPNVSILADPQQIERVLINLISNAVEAIDGAGEVRVAVRSAKGDAILMVSDSGRGMTSEVRDHAFEPYYTTRRKEGGTGLGLTTVYGIVDRFGGTIQIDSVLDVGTVFTMAWPQTSAPSPDLSEHPSSLSATPAGNLPTILVVDDDAAVRRVVVRALAGAGYRLFKAESVADAHVSFAKGGDQIDMLLTDVVLGDGNGYELGMSLRKQRPDLPILYMSGYAREVLEPYAEGQLSPLLEKPFTADQIIDAVAAMFPN